MLKYLVLLLSFSSSSSPSKRTKRSRYAELANGTKVKAKFQGKYYDGTVEKMFKNGSYDIFFPLKIIVLPKLNVVILKLCNFAI